ncbi:MAG: alpha/beta fold hydrolase, partial [Dehalococcoidia bacterium]
SSALTFDFRGHGASEGEVDDIEGMLNDVRAAIAFAQEHRYRQIMLVGAGMGGAIAIVAAAEYPEVTVVGFSVPSDFDVFTPLQVASEVRDRISVVASSDDLSAAYALRQFRDEAGIDAEHAVEYPGGAHGVDMLSGRAGADVRAHFDRLLSSFWKPASQAVAR